ncbi:ROK family transcriptional regulator [Jiangella asiatica]|uniref:ROK family transcriptional regulator n=1 Tax=Jiangella asiatica TaxID=2530372 RepID=UPI0013A5DE20|nr:ROK family transcriptional regulator [Jiangella asiatica]
MPRPHGVHALVRRTHEGRILEALRERGPLSRGQIARKVGLSRTTLSEITSSLLARGAIVVVDTDAAERRGSGRPAERLALDPRSGQFLGIDFGHRRVHISVADAAHEIVASGAHRYGDADWTERLKGAFGLLDRLGRETGVHFAALQGVGIGIPFSTPYGASPGEDPASDLRATFEDHFGTPVVIDNNTRLAALAEAIEMPGGAARDLVYVRLSDGVGGGLVVGGRLVSGANGVAGELGHVRAVPDGRRCRCGRRGCLETVASVPAIVAECRARGVAVTSLADLESATWLWHPVVDDVLRDAAGALGRVLAAVTLALNPARIVVGGELVRVAPVFLRHVVATLRRELFTTHDATSLVRGPSLGDDDGSLGAIAALYHQSLLIVGYQEPSTTAAVSRTRSFARMRPT